MRRSGPTETQQAVALQCASLLLDYPDAALYDRLPLLRSAADRLPGGAATALLAMVDHLEMTDQHAAERAYVDLFDLRRRCCLFLTYYAYGDTRKRGMALLRFTNAYKAAGQVLGPGEFAATHDQHQRNAQARSFSADLLMARIMRRAQLAHRRENRQPPPGTAGEDPQTSNHARWIGVVGVIKHEVRANRPRHQPTGHRLRAGQAGESLRRSHARRHRGVECERAIGQIMRAKQGDFARAVGRVEAHAELAYHAADRQISAPGRDLGIIKQRQRTTAGSRAGNRGQRAQPLGIGVAAQSMQPHERPAICRQGGENAAFFAGDAGE